VPDQLQMVEYYWSGRDRGGQASSAFPTVNQFCVGLLYGRAER
jgi:hypothetical protein